MKAIIAAIRSVRDAITETGALNPEGSPSLLSQYVVELASLNHRLAETLGHQQYASKSRKAKVFNDERAKGTSPNQADILARMDSTFIGLESDVEHLEIIIKQTGNLISACQTHIKVKIAEASSTL